MIDAFGVVHTDISKGAPIKGQLALFPLKGMTRAKRTSSFGYGHSSSYNPVLNRQAKQIPGQTYLSSQKAKGTEFKIVSPKPPKTDDDIALSPEGQKFLEFRLKRLDKEYAGRFASSGPKVSRNDPTDNLLNSRKAESVSRLSGRQRVGKSDAFGVERISKGLPSYLRQAGTKPMSGYSRLKIDSNKYGKASAKAKAEHYAGKKSPEVTEAWYLGKISTKSFHNDKWMNAMRYQSKGRRAAENRRKIEGIKQRPLRNI